VRARPATSQARAGLVADVKDRRTQTDQLQRRADDLRAEVTRQRDAALAGEGGEGNRLRDLDAAAGLSEVRGTGVVVRLADAAQPQRRSARPPVTASASPAPSGGHSPGSSPKRFVPSAPGGRS